MGPWLLTLGLLVVVGLSAFAIGLVVGGDVQRARLLEQFREQKRQDGAEPDWFRGDHS